MRVSPGEETSVTSRALTEVCVSRCGVMRVSGGAEQWVHREAAECRVRSSGIGMSPPSGGQKRCASSSEQYLSAGAEGSVCLLGSGGAICRRQQGDVCVGGAEDSVSGRKANVD